MAESWECWRVPRWRETDGHAAEGGAFYTPREKCREGQNCWQTVRRAPFSPHRKSRMSWPQCWRGQVFGHGWSPSTWERWHSPMRPPLYSLRRWHDGLLHSTGSSFRRRVNAWHPRHNWVCHKHIFGENKRFEPATSQQHRSFDFATLHWPLAFDKTATRRRARAALGPPPDQEGVKGGCA